MASTAISPHGRACVGFADRLVDLGQSRRSLRALLDALGPAPRAELLRVLMLPDFDRADRIGEFWGNPKTPPSPSY
jgi:hypothetical protein